MITIRTINAISMTSCTQCTTYSSLYSIANTFIISTIVILRNAEIIMLLFTQYVLIINESRRVLYIYTNTYYIHQYINIHILYIKTYTIQTYIIYIYIRYSNVISKNDLVSIYHILILHGICNHNPIVYPIYPHPTYHYSSHPHSTRHYIPLPRSSPYLLYPAPIPTLHYVTYLLILPYAGYIVSPVPFIAHPKPRPLTSRPAGLVLISALVVTPGAPRAFQTGHVRFAFTLTSSSVANTVHRPHDLAATSCRVVGA